MNDKTIRYMMRTMAVFSGATIGLLLFLNILTMVTDLDPEAIVGLQKSNAVIRALGILLGLFGPASVMLLWVLMLYHWGTHQFGSAGQKKAWLAALLLGNMMTALVYYFVVFERGWTLSPGKDRGRPT